MTENFKIKLCLKIFIMFEDIPDSIEETLYLSRDTELPYIPQVYSYILTNLHSNDFGRRRFKVRYVTTPLGYWKNNPTEEKRFELIEKTEVITEDEYKLSDLCRLWNFENMDDLIKKCEEYGWSVVKGSDLHNVDGDPILGW